MGEDPNNYICFGTSDRDKCTSNPDLYMYRIIGIFEDDPDGDGTSEKYLKLIKYIGIHDTTYAMDDNYNTNNQWNNTTLSKNINGNTFLTNGYYAYMNKPTWLNKIVDWTWSRADSALTAYNNSGVKVWEQTPSQIYCFENGMTDCYDTANGEGTYYKDVELKIGLMYISDYVLSVGASALTAGAVNTDETKALLMTGWMYNDNTTFSNSATGTIEWTMTRGGNAVTDLTNANFYAIRKDGYPNNVENRYGQEVRPVFYISADEVFDGGLGTVENPFTISDNGEDATNYLHIVENGILSDVADYTVIGKGLPPNGNYSSSAASSSITIVQNTDYIRVNPYQTDRYGMAYFTTPVDVTDYSRLVMTGDFTVTSSDGWPHLAIWTSIPTNNIATNRTKFTSFTSSRTTYATIDLSSYTGNYYIGLGMYSSSQQKIRNVWLEK